MFNVRHQCALPSPPIRGFLKMYMLCGNAGLRNPKPETISRTRSLNVNLLKVGCSTCKA